MDIRQYLKKPRLEDNSANQPSTSAQAVEEISLNTEETLSDVIEEHPSTSNANVFSQSNINEYDIGNFVNPITPLSNDLIYNLLQNPWTPSEHYNFKNDVNPNKKRCFSKSWLQKYGSWLAYSKLLKGAFCKHCVLFKPTIKRGYQGAFIKTPYTRYKDFVANANGHLKTEWHKYAFEKAQNFLKIAANKQKSIISQIDEKVDKEIETNRKILFSIVKTIKYCGTHDIALRGKLSTDGNFVDLLQFRVESGDSTLDSHFKTCAENSKYISVQTQNELISICGEIIKTDIANKIKNEKYFSLLADESCDISGKEQLSIGIRYVDSNTGTLCEDFVGFTPLTNMDAMSISNVLLKTLNDLGLDSENMVGQGYDGCATMAGKDNGVQSKIQEKYPKAVFFHCASHKLNLVINDLNKVPEIRNATEIIKNCIRFFRESASRRRLVPNIPLLCETRWTEKYKAIRIFGNNLVKIVNVLEELSHGVEINRNTRQLTNTEYNSLTTPTFIVSMIVIASYSALLEPIVNKLQGTQVNLSEVRKHVNILTDMLKSHRAKPDLHLEGIWQKCEKIALELDVQLKRPRYAAKQTQRANYDVSNEKEFFKVSLFIPYLDSIISSFDLRLSANTQIPFKLAYLHPINSINISDHDLNIAIKEIGEFYNLENLETEIKLWLFMWQQKKMTQELLNQVTYFDLLEESKDFYPGIHSALKIFITLPCTTCSIERSFSTLRRIKTWIRSTMSDNRLNGLALMSIHRKRILDDEQFNEKVVQIFASSPRRLQFLHKNVGAT